MADIQGTYDRLFIAVPNALADMLDAGDAGGSVAVFVDGEPVVDVWGGFTDADRTVPWERDTIVNVFSVTKTMTALCALVLIDRGELDPDAPVARYWPEFAAEGKEKVLVQHLLSHTAGLPDWDGPIDELYDWPAATSRLAARTTRWEPGTAAGYHSLTQGFLVGEVVRRVTGRSVGDFLAAEVTRPLGADFHIGLPAEHDHRAAPSIPPTGKDEDYSASAPGNPTGSRRATASECATATAQPGAARRSPRRAATATPARSRWCSRSWPAGERWAAYGCCPGPAATGPLRNSSTATTASSACRCAGAWATASSAPRTAGAAGAAP